MNHTDTSIVPLILLLARKQRSLNVITVIDGFIFILDYEAAVHLR